MSLPSLLLPPDLRAQALAYFEPRAVAVDRGELPTRDGIAFACRCLLAEAGNADHPNADLTRVVEVIATVAWSDMSCAFALWCQRMALEYLALAPPGSFLREELLPRVARVEWLGSTGLAGAMAHYVAGVPLRVSAVRRGGTVTLSGRLSWASNLFPPAFVLVTAAQADGEPIIVAIPGDVPGLHIEPYPPLMALQATGSSSVCFEEVMLGPEWVLTQDFRAFIARVRPPFLLAQSAFAWGLAARALAESEPQLQGVNAVLRPEFEALSAEAARLAAWIREAARSRGQEATPRDLVQARLDCARLATQAVALEAKATGGRGYVATTSTARRLREAAFLPIQSPTEGQLRWELSQYA